MKLLELVSLVTNQQLGHDVLDRVRLAQMYAQASFSQTELKVKRDLYLMKKHVDARKEWSQKQAWVSSSQHLTTKFAKLGELLCDLRSVAFFLPGRARLQVLGCAVSQGSHYGTKLHGAASPVRELGEWIRLSSRFSFLPVQSF